MTAVSQCRVLLMVILSMTMWGCSTTTAITPVSSSKSGFEGAAFSGETVELESKIPGEVVYRLFEQGATGFVSLLSLRDSVQALATNFCERKGKSVRPIQETTSKPPHILGNFPRLEWQFQCTESLKHPGISAPTGDKLTQLERLKKLLENGTLTPPEFEAEKLKILATP
jgi:hypothetical protein